jgi:hypothetical protein
MGEDAEAPSNFRTLGILTAGGGEPLSAFIEMLRRGTGSVGRARAQHAGGPTLGARAATWTYDQPGAASRPRVTSWERHTEVLRQAYRGTAMWIEAQVAQRDPHLLAVIGSAR